MNIEELDDFLDDATHAVCDLYGAATGHKVDSEFLHSINDALDELFRPLTHLDEDEEPSKPPE
jgi:hypothetical protein